MSKKQRNVPKLRFPEFKGEWEQGKVSTIITDIADGPFGSNLKTEHYTDEKEARIIQLSNLSDYGWQEENTKYTTFEHAKEIKRCIVNEGELVMGKMMPAGLTIMRPNTEKMYVLSSDCVRIKLDNDRVTDKFFLYVTKSNTFLNQINTDSQGSTRIRTSISKIREMDISLPSVTEQDRIGDFFSKLDTLITLQQRKLDQIKEYKKGMLQKMFPKEGESVPEVRLPGFTGEWELRKLSNLTSLITKGTTPLDKSGVGEINFIKVENLDSNSGEIISCSKITKEEHEGYLKRSQLKENDILFSIAGTLGRVGIVRLSVLPANTNQALSIIRLKDGCLKYMATVLRGNAVERFIRRNPTIGAQPNLSLEQVGNLEIPYPQIDEQRVIGDFFDNLDTLINLHQRKLEAMKEYKKGLLQKMFV